MKREASELARQVVALASKSNDLILVLKTHRLE